MKNIFGIVGMDVIMAPGAEAGYLWEKINLEKSVGCERGGGGFSSGDQFNRSIWCVGYMHASNLVQTPFEFVNVFSFVEN